MLLDPTWPDPIAEIVSRHVRLGRIEAGYGHWSIEFRGRVGRFGPEVSHTVHYRAPLGGALNADEVIRLSRTDVTIEIMGVLGYPPLRAGWADADMRVVLFGNPFFYRDHLDLTRVPCGMPERL